jgi:ribonucleoside-diphosphate reductase alpha chain
VRIPDAFFDAVDKGRPGRRSAPTGEIAKTVDAGELWDDIALRRVAVRRPGRAVRFDDQRVAHLPERGSDQREQPVQRVHVPRQHGVQPGVASTCSSSSTRESGPSTSIGSSTPSTLDDRARDQRAHGGVPEQRDRRAQLDRYRTLGLGYANLGAMLMQAGIPYDSDEGRAICGAITSILTGRVRTA